MSIIQHAEPKFRVGDWVFLQSGVRPIWAQVVEDRGPLGVNRRRLYRIRFDVQSDDDSSEAISFEMPEDDLTRAQPDPARVIDYLKRGGLLAILRSNLGGGRDQPRAWLTFDARGDLIHTFNADRGLLGGASSHFSLCKGARFLRRNRTK